MIFRKKKKSLSEEPVKVQYALDFLEEKHEDRDGARRVLRDWVFQEAMGPDPLKDPAVRLLVSALVNGFKPAYLGDAEMQGRVDRVVEDLKQGKHKKESEPLLEELRALIAGLGKLSTRQSDRMHLAIRWLPDILQAVHTLTRGEAWAEEQSLMLIEQSGVLPPGYWERLGSFCSEIREAGVSSFERWEESRKALVDLIAEIADRMRVMRKDASGATGRLDETLSRIRTTTRLGDLESLRGALVTEAEALRSQTQSLATSLSESQAQLDLTRKQLQQVQDDLKKAKEESLTDPLTQVANRRALFQSLTRETARTRRYGEPLSLIIIDLDHFKKINDTYGHPVGDRVLKEVAGHARALLRDSDTLARYGGEEFVALLPETTLPQAMEKAEQIRLSVAAMRFKLKGESLSISASLGVAQLDDGASQDANNEAFVHRADQALYRAKSGGRNCVIQADPTPASDSQATS
ncbi:diguanylate cyclase [Magnetococcus marinus MC-1]|uniref:diguanylate cyclase n=1 Tax=Magnetococcus marinus (strain ATCC BAA-1437 / JCM 17883 / MC-1) TaxID=156889 RepID=A0L4D8_MAGMM|nr:GGDEF domain-containing protein [Magnetococcus marinus]ABK42831.1 diguanylate cyclase [Magnetococcus marinus MC-1]